LKLCFPLLEYCLRSVGYNVRALRKDKNNKNYNCMSNDEKSIIRSLTDFLRDYKVQNKDGPPTRLQSRSRKKMANSMVKSPSASNTSEASAEATPRAPKVPKEPPKAPRNKHILHWDDDSDDDKSEEQQ